MHIARASATPGSTSRMTFLAIWHRADLFSAECFDNEILSGAPKH
jgi:hypothetical protein